MAKNKKGIAQNGVERDGYAQQAYGDIVGKIFEVDENDLWLEMELAKKISTGRFKSLIGVSIENLWRYLVLRYYENNGKAHEVEYWKEKISPDEWVKLEEEGSFANRVTNLMLDMDFPVGDFGRPSTYGEVLRDGKPALVIVDLGLNKAVSSDFYGVN